MNMIYFYFTMGHHLCNHTMTHGLLDAKVL